MGVYRYVICVILSSKRSKIVPQKNVFCPIHNELVQTTAALMQNKCKLSAYLVAVILWMDSLTAGMLASKESLRLPG